MASVTIPTVIFRNPIPAGGLYDIQGLLLAFGKHREAPGLTEPERVRLMQLAATGEWLASGGEMEEGVWMKDGEVCSYDQKDTLSFIRSHYQGHQVSLVPVEYDREAWGCCGLFCDVLGAPAIGKQIRDWVELHGTWYQIDYFLSLGVDVENRRVSPQNCRISTVKTSFKNDDDEDDFL